MWKVIILDFPPNLLAHWTSIGAAFRVHLQIRFQIEALDVLAVLAARRQRYPLECDGTLERHLQRGLLHAGRHIFRGRVRRIGTASRSCGRRRCRWRLLLAGAEVALDLVGALFERHQVTFEQTLDNVADGRPVDKLQNE